VAQWLAPKLLDGSAPEMGINEEIRAFVRGLLAEADWPPPPPPGMEVPEGMVWVPPGPFIMGGEYGFPVQVARVEQGFFVARTPVTSAQYRCFVEAGGYDKREYWSDEGWRWKQSERWTKPRFWDALEWSQPNQPVVGVSWYEAEAYAHWVGMRLPTEQEWEKAARGIDGREYPWGDRFDPDRCNTDESGIGKTTPVGKYSPRGDSPCGALDMAGNVLEWCVSLYVEWSFNWYDAEKYNVVRGRSWRDNLRNARCAYRAGCEPSDRYDNVGFRVSRDSFPNNC